VEIQLRCQAAARKGSGATILWRAWEASPVPKRSFFLAGNAGATVGLRSSSEVSRERKTLHYSSRPFSSCQNQELTPGAADAAGLSTLFALRLIRPDIPAPPGPATGV